MSSSQPSAKYRTFCVIEIFADRHDCLSQKANFLQSVGEKTPIFIRFSTVTLGREFPDEARNPRGFAIKFYTMEVSKWSIDNSVRYTNFL